MMMMIILCETGSEIYVASAAAPFVNSQKEREKDEERQRGRGQQGPALYNQIREAAITT